MGKRRNQLTAQKVEVGIVFQQMLANNDAMDYMSKNGVPVEVAIMVLTERKSRRGTRSSICDATAE